MDGFINLLKPPGMTSSDAVAAVRRLLARGTRVGHGGTLDPDAAGVLPICVGRGARLFDYMIDKQKEYLAELRLGVATNTQDASGRPTAVCPVSCGAAEVRAALGGFTGEIMQTPPAYSAVKFGGRRMYDLARSGDAPVLAPRPARVDAIEYMGQTTPDTHRLLIRCGKGVYIRALCHDIGATLGCGGHMAFLLRTRAGVFDLAGSATPDELRLKLERGEGDKCLYRLDAPIEHLPAARLDGRSAHAVLNGQPCPAPRGTPPETPLRVYCGDAFAGVGERRADEKIHMKAVLLERST